MRPPACAPLLRAELELVDVDNEPVPVLVEDAVVPDEPVDEFEEEGGVPSADEALAVAWNASNVLFAVGLIAKTMPVSQWPV